VIKKVLGRLLPGMKECKCVRPSCNKPLHLGLVQREQEKRKRNAKDKEMEKDRK